MLLWEAPTKPSNGNEEKEKRHRVVVYTTPSCAWCNRLKSHLRKNRVMFQEVDVSRDQHAAEELMRRSGQSDIDGEIIVGFDQARIDRLLDLN
ncbi:MAG: NrdH-redoxin [Actinobacteria bacterium]|nr:NrdH-redoxin [Actinomycetota bacterium]